MVNKELMDLLHKSLTYHKEKLQDPLARGRKASDSSQVCYFFSGSHTCILIFSHQQKWRNQCSPWEHQSRKPGGHQTADQNVHYEKARSDFHLGSHSMYLQPFFSWLIFFLFLPNTILLSLTVSNWSFLSESYFLNPKENLMYVLYFKCAQEASQYRFRRMRLEVLSSAPSVVNVIFVMREWNSCWTAVICFHLDPEFALWLRIQSSLHFARSSK